MSAEAPQSPSTQPPESLLTRRNIKIAVWLLCVIVAVIIVVQNWGDVETHLLFITITTSQSLLLVLMLAIGFAMGLTVRFSRRKKA
jgi:hypothetical protein